VAESGIIAEGDKAESHRANAVAFLLTQTNLYPKVLGRGQTRLPAGQRPEIAAETEPAGRNTIQLSLFIILGPFNVCSDSIDIISRRSPSRSGYRL